MWIEIPLTFAIGYGNLVTPYAGVWIEIFALCIFNQMPVSLPTRECGLKSRKKTVTMRVSAVTPYAGVWIEIHRELDRNLPVMSLPTRECGLKSPYLY